MRKNSLVAPVVKWVGGKRQLIDTLVPLMPSRMTSYCEPFLGGGAMLFTKRPKVAYVNDINSELINMYQVIRDDVDELIKLLGEYKNESEFFYKVRDWDRDVEKYKALSNVEKASRILYLNKTCYNGLFRVNNAGEFNSPFGNYKNPNIVNAPVLKAVSNYFSEANITFYNADFTTALEPLTKGAFVYLDPPYDPVTTTANFTGYTRGGFDRNEQIRLKQCCDELDRRGIKFMVSNSSTDFIRELYNDKKYNITTVQARRAINSLATGRGEVDEVVIRNYE